MKKLTQQQKQRMKRGYSDSDLFSLDSYLYKVIGHALKDFADTYPGFAEADDTFIDNLRDIAEKLLKAYKEQFNYENESRQTVIDQANNALKELSYLVNGLWY